MGGLPIKVNGERTEPGKPFTADDPPDPQDPYGVSKAEAEAALMALGRETGMEITIIRPPLVYGPGVRGNFRSLMTWAASGMPSIFSAVENKRSIIYVENLSDLLIKALDHPRAANQIFLAGDHSSVSSHSLLCSLASAIGRKQLSVPMPAAMLKTAGTAVGKRAMVERLLCSLEADTEATREALSWSPSIDFTTALHRTVSKYPQAASRTLLGPS
jgi:nucleoside-diphosphate-sugar epimerase